MYTKTPHAFIVFVELATYSNTNEPLSVCLMYFLGILTTNTLLKTVDVSFGSISIPRLRTYALSVPNNWLGPLLTCPLGIKRITQCTVLTTVTVSADKLNSQKIHFIWLPIETSVLLSLFAWSTARDNTTLWVLLESCARWLKVTSCLLLTITGRSRAN